MNAHNVLLQNFNLLYYQFLKCDIGMQNKMGSKSPKKATKSKSTKLYRPMGGHRIALKDS